MKPFAMLLAAVLLPGCTDPLPVANNVSAVEVNGVEEVMPSEGGETADATNVAGPGEVPRGFVEADYLGRWTGIEGMFLNVVAKPGGGVTMDMQWDLDNKGKFDGSVTAEGLRFTRGGVAETAVPTDGDATGLKYLAGKKDCLTVKPGEGYCRD